MKRHAWLTLGLGLSVALVGCSDDESKDNGSTEVDGGIGDYSDDIKNLNDGLDELGGKLDGLGGELDGLAGRVKDLETPGACSAGELCIPDGLDAVATGFDAIVDALCTHEVNCCDANELNYQFGAGIKDVASCKASFKDSVERGYTPTFITSDLLDDVVMVAHALSDPNIHVKINADGVKACADSIKGIKCKPDEGGEEPAGCVYPPPAYENPCGADKILVGLEKEQDVCNVGNSLPGTVPECEPGLVCMPASPDACDNYNNNTLTVNVRTNYYYGYSCPGQTGVCVRQPKAGDSCRDDDQCGALFCDQTTGKCKERAKVGEACAYIDPTFDFVNAAPFNNYVTKIDCEDGLRCDPNSNKCVSYCDEGWACQGDDDCADGLVCNRNTNDDLRSHGYGRCTQPIAAGQPCQTYTECASGECAYDSTDSRYECTAPKKKPGEACTTAGYDNNCATGYCDTTLKCAAPCDETDGSDGQDYSCGAGFYCAWPEIQAPVCLTKIANGSACDGAAWDSDLSCTGGFCNEGTCDVKVAKDALCPANDDDQCQDTQFCAYDSTAQAFKCQTPKAIGATCTPDSNECGRDAYCYDTKGQNAPADFKCYSLDADLPNGTPCDGEDDYCQSGWCQYTGSAYVCAAKIKAGAACDTEDSTKSECEDGTYCAYAVDSTAGTCKAKGTVGQPCDPRFYGLDCWNNAYCSPQYDTFLCSGGALKPDTAYCDGE